MLSSHAFTWDLVALSGLNAMALADQGVTWAREIGSQCHSGAPLMDFRGSFKALAWVFACVELNIAPQARALIEDAMAGHCTLYWYAHADRPLVDWGALMRVDLLSLSLVDPEALRDFLAAFPLPPVCSGPSCHGGQGSQTRSLSDVFHAVRVGRSSGTQVDVQAMNA